MSLKGKHILIIVENLPLPFDRRVWQEANTLTDAGAKVSVICPQMKGFTKKFETINGIDIYRHPLPVEGSGAWGYLVEYSTALFWEFWLSWKIYFKKRFQVIQGCNPPDLIFIPALLFKLFGVKYVFDHHDINPELYIAKYGKKGFFYKFLLTVERLTFRTANFSIATNESYKRIAVERGKMPEDRVRIVRSGPKLDRLTLGPGDEKYKKGRRFLIGYIGVIGEQEGIDLLLESAKYITDNRNDVQFAIVGGGTQLEALKKMAGDMNIEEYVDFYGRVDDKTMVDVLNTADVCVNPDKPTEMNDLSTMNKIMEYMALKKPIVQYDLKEGRYSAREAALYATNTDTTDFAHKILWLLDHEEERKSMGNYGYNRVINELSWEYESKKLIDFYEKVFAS
ncbi:MAG: glycosyltransferase family 4 protein [Sphingobacteriales bacterium]|nr:glycosyltransferase family 4 protein [Sphingobacteriales bacterium]OJY81214.1 MAG: glycosyltransferase WbuB [Sphingobacteriales bacterium 44-15]